MRSSILLAFTTAGTVAVARDQVHYNSEAYNHGEWGALPTNAHHSTSETSPQIQVNIWNKEAVSNSGSHIVLQHDVPAGPRRAGARSTSSSPLMIRTDDLSAVYSNHSFPGVANVNVQIYDGAPFLSFYGGPLEDSTNIGNGFIFAYDQDYNEVGRLSAGHLKVGADAHEFIMTGDNTAVVTAYETIEWDLRVYGGDENGRVLDSIFQEIDLDTFEVLFEWRASEHFALDKSYKQLEPDATYGWDFFHITSVQKSASGNYLVSAANMHSIYMIDGNIGRVIWTLGGKGNDFEELQPAEGKHFSAPLLTMAWQHHAQFYPGRNEREFTVFDNHGISINGWGCQDNCSRGLHFELDPDARKVRLINEYLHPQGLWSVSQGSVQVLDDGNVFIGWGRNPAITEHRPDGECVFDIQFSPWRSPSVDWNGLDSYRAFKVNWEGHPRWTPDVAAQRGSSGDLTVWASWNGATEVKEWVLLSSTLEKDLTGANKVAARAARDGFETVLWVDKFDDRYVRVVALGDKGQILRASGILDTRYGKVKPANYPVTEVDPPPNNAGKPGGHAQGGSESAEGDEKKKPGMPPVTYHDLFPNTWSFGGILFRITGFGLGVWMFSRLF